MPSYDFRCNDCKRRVVLTFKTYGDYDSSPKVCPRCHGTNLVRTIGRINISKSETTRFEDVNESAMDDLADADPATLGRFMRRMSQETGEDLGQEFNEVVERLEKGEDPESIEATMALPDESPVSSLADAGGSGDE